MHMRTAKKFNNNCYNLGLFKARDILYFPYKRVQINYVVA